MEEEEGHLLVCRPLIRLKSLGRGERRKERELGLGRVLKVLLS